MGIPRGSQHATPSLRLAVASYLPSRGREWAAHEPLHFSQPGCRHGAGGRGGQVHAQAREGLFRR